MFIVKKTGLVPVMHTKRGARTGVFGVTPAKAHAGVLSGVLVLVTEIPSDIDVIEVEDPVSPKQPAPPAVEATGPVEIPPDWATGHALTWIKIAKAIIGGDIVLTDEQKTAGVKVSDVAKAIIEEEVKRRAAADTPAE